MNAISRGGSVEVMTLVERIRPMLAGKPPELQGAVLADLVAIWIAGHQIAGDGAATRSARAEMLAIFLKAVTELVPVNAHLLGTTQTNNTRRGKRVGFRPQQ